MGQFNPAIFQPAWFTAQNLLRAAEADNANIDIIRPEICKFTADWVQLEVLQERFLASTIHTNMEEPLKDLVLGTFRILHHTPVQQLEITKEMHIKLDTEDAWHAIGNKLTPKTIWESIVKKPGMASLTIQGERTDNRTGAFLVKVEPSRRPEFHPAIFFQITDRVQFPVAEKAPSLGCEKVMDVLTEIWPSSLRRAKECVSKLMNA